jgi:hypothetical protein
MKNGKINEQVGGNWRGRHSTVDLHIKLACFVIRSIKFSIY